MLVVGFGVWDMVVHLTALDKLLRALPDLLQVRIGLEMRLDTYLLLATPCGRPS